MKVYAAVKAAGLKTYATKDPVEPDAAAYAPYLDIWCSQPYSVLLEQIAGQKRYEYWCYPNHNAGEIKDRLTMCKGGRMTYGFGFWRSGYTTLIPWHWCWTCAPDQFDYLRGGESGCGQRMDDDGEVIPAVYWSCFREGFDDARYVYTLQQAVMQRQDAVDPACQAAVRDGETTPSRDVGLYPGPTKIPGRRHVAFRRVRRHPLAAGGRDRETVAVSCNQRDDGPISLDRHGTRGTGEDGDDFAVRAGRQVRET